MNIYITIAAIVVSISLLSLMVVIIINNKKDLDDVEQRKRNRMQLLKSKLKKEILVIDKNTKHVNNIHNKFKKIVATVVYKDKERKNIELKKQKEIEKIVALNDELKKQERLKAEQDILKQIQEDIRKKDEETKQTNIKQNTLLYEQYRNIINLNTKLDEIKIVYEANIQELRKEYENMKSKKTSNSWLKWIKQWFTDNDKDIDIILQGIQKQISELQNYINTHNTLRDNIKSIEYLNSIAQFINTEDYEQFKNRLNYEDVIDILSIVQNFDNEQIQKQRILKLKAILAEVATINSDLDEKEIEIKEEIKKKSLICSYQLDRSITDVTDSNYKDIYSTYNQDLDKCQCGTIGSGCFKNGSFEQNIDQPIFLGNDEQNVYCDLPSDLLSSINHLHCVNKYYPIPEDDVGDWRGLLSIINNVIDSFSTIQQGGLFIDSNERQKIAEPVIKLYKQKWFDSIKDKLTNWPERYKIWHEMYKEIISDKDKLKVELLNQRRKILSDDCKPTSDGYLTYSLDVLNDMIKTQNKTVEEQLDIIPKYNSSKFFNYVASDNNITFEYDEQSPDNVVIKYNTNTPGCDYYNLTLSKSNAIYDKYKANKNVVLLEYDAPRISEHIVRNNLDYKIANVNPSCQYSSAQLAELDGLDENQTQAFINQFTNITSKSDQKLKKLPPWDLYQTQIACEDFTKDQVDDKIKDMKSSCDCTEDGWVFDETGGQTYMQQIGCVNQLKNYNSIGKTKEQIKKQIDEEKPGYKSFCYVNYECTDPKTRISEYNKNNKDSPNVKYKICNEKNNRIGKPIKRPYLTIRLKINPIRSKTGKILNVNGKKLNGINETYFKLGLVQNKDVNVRINSILSRFPIKFTDTSIKEQIFPNTTGIANIIDIYDINDSNSSYDTVLFPGDVIIAANGTWEGQTDEERDIITELTGRIPDEHKMYNLEYNGYFIQFKEKLMKIIYNSSQLIIRRDPNLLIDTSDIEGSDRIKILNTMKSENEIMLKRNLLGLPQTYDIVMCNVDQFKDRTVAVDERQPLKTDIIKTPEGDKVKIGSKLTYTCNSSDFLVQEFKCDIDGNMKTTTDNIQSCDFIDNKTDLRCENLNKFTLHKIEDGKCHQTCSEHKISNEWPTIEVIKKENKNMIDLGYDIGTCESKGYINEINPSTNTDSIIPQYVKEKLNEQSNSMNESLIFTQ